MPRRLCRTTTQWPSASLRWNPLPATLLPILEKEVSGPTAFHADQLKLWQPAVLKISDFFDETGQGFEPVRSLVSTEEVGNLAAFLLSEKSFGITAETVYIDGGFNKVAGRLLKDE